MKFFNREKSTIECPRCGLRSLVGTESCPECGLVFSRLQLATNKDAKKKLLRGDRDFILYTTSWPNDIRYYKLLLMTIFLGLFGGHCFYTGRYLRGGLLLLNSIALICYTIFNAPLYAIGDGSLIAVLATVSGLIMLLWIYDLVRVVIKRFKVPIAIDLNSEGESK